MSSKSMFPTILPNRELQRTCPVTPILQGIFPAAFSAGRIRPASKLRGRCHHRISVYKQPRTNREAVMAIALARPLSRPSDR